MTRRLEQAKALLARGVGLPVSGQSGQATVEYLVVGAVLIIAIVGIAALWKFVSGGGFSALMVSDPSHALNGLGGAADVLLY